MKVEQGKSKKSARKIYRQEGTSCILVILRWILKNLHDPMYLIYWELWYSSILGSYRIFSINSIRGVLGMGDGFGSLGAF